ncbi:hypothetical protein GCM10017600_28980 [Streptosporangium carneum]|uniref:Uncharacterized protein n=1 Tax=Streptosporangium carneum TaxID=47481 RepID=A0A9W6MCX7_9ACTN|nr:hypothetical protein GCM10017600_28980 [Streptosporangium carneum]
MTNILIFLAAAVLLAVVGPRYGADTRDSLDWTPVEPFPPECAVAPVVTGSEAGRAYAGRRASLRKAGAVGASGPHRTIRAHRL